MSPIGFARAVLALSALPFAAIGLAFVFAPEAMAARVDVSLASVTADHDVRAVYGGLQVACAVLLGWGAFSRHAVRPALVAQLALYGGLVGGRLVGWIASGAPGSFGLWLHGLELLGLAAGGLAFYRLSKEGRE
jgi:hypothetical protein